MPACRERALLGGPSPRLTDALFCNYSSHMPSTVGIREAKANLSRLVKQAAKGDRITITEHGRAVARLVPVDDDTLSVEQRLKELEARGWIVKQATSGKIPPLIKTVPKGLAQRLLRADRDGR